MGFVAQDLENNGETFVAWIIDLVHRYVKMTSVLQYTDDVRVARILISPKERTMPHSFVLSIDVRFMYAHFNVLLSIVRQVWQRNIWTIQKLGQHISIHEFLLYVVRFEVDYLDVVRVAVVARAVAVVFIVLSSV